MKILLITAYYKEEARSIPTSYKLARLFAEHGDDVVVLTSKAMSKRTDEPHKRIKVYESKDVFIKDPLNLNVMPYLFNDLSKILKKERPDVCIVSKYIFFPIIAVPYLKMKKQKVVVVTDTYPGVVWFTRSKAINFLAKMHYNIVGRSFLKASDLVVLTHEELIEPTKRLGIKNYAVIHNGIDLKKSDSAKPAKDLPIKQGEVVIAFVGRLASIKGLDTFLDAAKDIVNKSKYNNVRFLLVGSGESNLLYKHPQINYLGYRKDVLNVLKRCDVLVMPSISEGLPAAVIEAMSCSLPVVSSDIPGGLKVLVKDKKSGLKFKVGNSGELKDRLEKLISSKSLRETYGKNGRKIIEQEFDNESTYALWKKELIKLIGEK